MITETMNVHKALSEVKILNDRILSKITENNFCVCNKVTNKVINGKSIDDWKKNTKDVWDSINQLILRREAIKRAISYSNASTKVVVADKEYTVAEAIEMKQYGIHYHRQLLNQLQKNFANVNAEVERINAEADTKATNYAQNCVGSDKTSPEVIKDIENIRKSYYDTHKAEIIDPLDSIKRIEELNDYIDKFTSEIDSVLSVANATTVITIEY